MSKFFWIDFKGSTCVVADLVLSSNIICCIIKVRVVGDRVESFLIDKAFEKLVDGLPAFLCSDCSIGMKQGEEHALFVVELFAG